MGRATIYKFKNINTGSDLKLLLIILEFGPKRFWFQTAADEDTISSSLKLETLLISWSLIINDLRSWTAIDMWSDSSSKEIVANRAHRITVFLIVIGALPLSNFAGDLSYLNPLNVAQ
jgi:hypothetical protein